MSLFADAMAMGYSHLEEARGVTATYTQQGTAIPNVIVIPRTSEGDRVPAGKVGMNVRVVGFSIKKAYLGAIVPKRGDTITVGSKVYKVASPSGDAVWTWSDANQTAYRIEVVE